MRILFCSTAAEGHFAPLVPLASAAREAGHEIAFATGPRFGDRVRRASFEAHSVGIDTAELERRFARVREELGSLPVLARRARAFTGRFAEIEAPARFADLDALVRGLRPDLLVHESCELAAPVVAASLGIGSITHSFGRAIPAAALEAGGRAVAPLWETAGLEPDRWAGAYRGRYVDICPPTLQTESFPTQVDAVSLRPVDARPREPQRRPVVYVTLGTLFGTVRLFRLLLESFAGLDCDVLLTTGHGVDVGDLGRVPANASVERFIPQSEILPRASVVVTHGGSGSMLGALAHGVPLLLVPQGADQFENAVACVTAGAGIAFSPPDQAAENLAPGLESLLHGDSFSQAAERVAREIAAMPDAHAVAAALFS